MLRYITESEEETEELGYYTACRYRNYKVFLLVGELGSGKTTFVRGFVRFFGILEVRSPSFVMINEYLGKKRIFHADLYRVRSEEDILTTGIMDNLNRGILLVEWGERLIRFIKGYFVEIRFEIISPNKRKINIKRRGLNPRPY